jgi:predicted PurR-regulated permease PerM
MNSYVNDVFSLFLNIFYSLIFGFYFLSSKNNRGYFNFVPIKLRNKINKDLRLYIKSILLDTLFIFILLWIIFSIIGLNNSIIFALFCSITNIIPYIGPYIGGIPAVLVGFSQGITTGILTLIVLCVIQFLEGNFLQPVILSKTTKLHPVTIILGLLIFGNLWGILGMIISTPLLAALKAIILFFDEKYDILDFN